MEPLFNNFDRTKDSVTRLYWAFEENPKYLMGEVYVCGDSVLEAVDSGMTLDEAFDNALQNAYENALAEGKIAKLLTGETRAIALIVHSN